MAALRHMVYGSRNGVFDADRLVDLLGALEQFVESSQTAMGNLNSLSSAGANGSSMSIIGSLNHFVVELAAGLTLSGPKASQQPQQQKQPTPGWPLPQFFPSPAMVSHLSGLVPSRPVFHQAVLLFCENQKIYITV
ncbi:hypothetical protein Vretimale_14264 [Volvox reticuliferus]|uniref:Uncharacterized protein n=1 Tax=Volvox reticuliferus TaxID=1737510 RepID=A0A8J4GNC1_9CHLO|nr:hypothetical protein Vretifemale_15260 [Volvox reticuliferus]GIM10664.1 hypothetical protein Vretimale_14264 [Volvox reticuliferus]